MADCCTICGKERLKAKTPGWKRDVAEALHCPACWKGAYETRCVTLPVAGVVEGGTWDEFTADLIASWELSTQLANWTAQWLAAHDVTRTPEMEKLPPAGQLYAYPDARKAFPTISPSTLITIQQGVRGKYGKERLDRIWYQRRRVPEFTFPYPWQVKATDYTPVLAEGRKPNLDRKGQPWPEPRVDVKLAGGKNYLLRLEAGPEWRRQLGQWRQLVSGAACQGVLSLTGREVTYAAGGQSLTRRRPSGGRRRVERIMVRVSAHFPRTGPKEGHTMLVRTDPEAYWVVEQEGRAPWILNADHWLRRVDLLRFWLARHATFRQRVSEDLKYEKRWPKRVRQQMVDGLDRRCRKQQDRVESFQKEAAALLANLAKRRGVGLVIYDDSDKRFCPLMAWHQQETLLVQALGQDGVRCIAREKGKGETMTNSRECAGDGQNHGACSQDASATTTTASSEPSAGRSPQRAGPRGGSRGNPKNCSRGSRLRGGP